MLIAELASKHSSILRHKNLKIFSWRAAKNKNAARRERRSHLLQV